MFCDNRKAVGKNKNNYVQLITYFCAAIDIKLFANNFVDLVLKAQNIVLGLLDITGISKIRSGHVKNMLHLLNST